MNKTCFCGIAEHCGYQIETDMEQHDKVIYEQGYNKAIDEAIKASANAICIGCGYLDGYKCTYKGGNCGVSKPMLESVVKALEQLKGGAE